jgi:hypothetical protein
MDHTHIRDLQEVIDTIVSPMEDGTREPLSWDEALELIDITSKLRYWISEQYPKAF